VIGILSLNVNYMKNNVKSFVLLCCALSVGVALSAQSFSVGPRVGLHIANIALEDGLDGIDIETDSRLGVDVGLMLNLEVASGLSLQPELHYIQKGYRLDFELLGLTVDATTTYHYLEVPLLIKYSVGQEAIKFYLNAGPSFGYAVAGQEKGELDGQSVDEDIDFEDYELKRTDLSVVAGGGLAIDIGQGATLLMDARYIYGLTNLDDSGDENIAERNRGLGLGLGVLVSIGK